MIKCPKCNSTIPTDKVNIQANIAQCISCGYVFSISENLTRTQTNFNFNDKPRGTWYRRNGNTTVVGATTRSPFAFFLLPFILVWSAISLGGVYGSQLLSGKFDIIMSLFGIPFLLASLLCWGVALMAAVGKVEVSTNGVEGRVFVGVGNIGWRKTFLWKDVDIIREAVVSDYQRSGAIVLDGSRRITFGFGLSSTRKYYMVRALQKLKPLS